MPDAPRCLIVGLLPSELPPTVALTGETVVITLAALARHLVPPRAVHLVVAPLFCPDFDALEVIETLARAGYRGSLRIVSPKLPNRQLVLRELRAHASRQGIPLDLVETA